MSFNVSNLSFVKCVGNYAFDQALKQSWFVEVSDELKTNLFRAFNKLQFEGGKKELDHRYEIPDLQSLTDELLKQISLLPNPVSLLVDVNFTTANIYEEHRTEYCYEERKLLLTFPLKGRLYGTSIGVLADADDIDSVLEDDE